MLLKLGGEGGIRTLEARFSELAPLAGVCLQPLGHFSALLSLHSNKNTHFIRLFIIFQVGSSRKRVKLINKLTKSVI